MFKTSVEFICSLRECGIKLSLSLIKATNIPGSAPLSGSTQKRFGLMVGGKTYTDRTGFTHISNMILFFLLLSFGQIVFFPSCSWQGGLQKSELVLE